MRMVSLGLFLTAGSIKLTVPFILFVTQSSFSVTIGFTLGFMDFRFLDCYCLRFFFFLFFIYISKLKTPIMRDDFVKLEYKMGRKARRMLFMFIASIYLSQLES